MGKPSTRVVGKNAAAPGCNDALVAILFGLHLTVMVVFMFCFLGNGASIDDFISEDAREANKHIVGASMLTAFYASLFSLIFVFIFLFIMKLAALLLIILMMLVTITLLIGGGVGMIAYASADQNTDTDNGGTSELSSGEATLVIITGVILAAIGALLLLWFCCIRSRIILTSKMLSAVAQVLFTVPGTMLVTFLMAFMQFVWAFVWGAAMLQCTEWLSLENKETKECTHTVNGVPVTYDCTTQDIPWGKWTGMEIALVLSFFWTHKVLAAISTTTVASVVAWWYFDPTSNDEGVPCCRPVTWVSFKRACTNYLGSIALGSLILAIVETIYYVCKKVVDTLVGPSPNLAVKVVACCFLCCLSCIKGTIEWLTEWAYIFIAIYGVGFFEAGSNVMGMLGESGAGAVAQSLLVEPVLWLGYLCCAGIGVGSGFLTLQSEESVATWSQAMWGCFVGFMVGYTALSCVKAGNKAIFVCYADDPSLLAERNGEIAAFIDENKKDAPAKPQDVEIVRP